jgi:hypothetical protein
MEKLAGSTETYIERIDGLSDEEMSLHATRHLPHRLAAGSVIMVHDRPAVFMAVIRKRWMHVMREIERARSSTMNHTLRDQLDRQLAHMQSYRFGTKLSDIQRLEALILMPQEVLDSGLRCLTLYITTPTTDTELARYAQLVMEPGLIVLYRAA